MEITVAAANRSRCVRGVRKIDGKYEKDADGNLIGQTRKFGCVIVKNDRVISHGFNDQYPGSPRCEDVGCLREDLGIPSGTQLEKCRAMHAEWWVITSALRGESGTGTLDASIYLNAEPCEICAKIITGLGIETMVLLEGVYATNGTQIVRDAGINIRYVKL